MIDEGITKEDWECMQEHPGKYCNECNPRTKHVEVGKQPRAKHETENSDSEDEDEASKDEESEDNEEGYVTADLSEPWSNSSETSDWATPTYEQIFDEKQAEAAVIEYWSFRIARVDAVVNRLEALDPETLSDTPIGGLRGKWYLYSLDHRPSRLDQASFYNRLEVSDDAVEGRIPSRERMTKSPYVSFIEWAIGDKHGVIAPFQLPSRPSLEAISIGLMRGGKEDAPAEIVFLGSDCLLFRAPRSILFPVQPGRADPMIEFAGLRRTEAEIAREKDARRISRERDTSPHHYFGESWD